MRRLRRGRGVVAVGPCALLKVMLLLLLVLLLVVLPGRSVRVVPRRRRRRRASELVARVEVRRPRRRRRRGRGGRVLLLSGGGGGNGGPRQCRFDLAPPPFDAVRRVPLCRRRRPSVDERDEAEATGASRGAAAHHDGVGERSCFWKSF